MDITEASTAGCHSRENPTLLTGMRLKCWQRSRHCGQGTETNSYNGNATRLGIPEGVRLILDDTHMGQASPCAFDAFTLPKRQKCLLVGLRVFGQQLFSKISPYNPFLEPTRRDIVKSCHRRALVGAAVGCVLAVVQ